MDHFVRIDVDYYYNIQSPYPSSHSADCTWPHLVVMCRSDRTYQCYLDSLLECVTDNNEPLLSYFYWPTWDSCGSQCVKGNSAQFNNLYGLSTLFCSVQPGTKTLFSSVSQICSQQQVWIWTRIRGIFSWNFINIKVVNMNPRRITWGRLLCCSLRAENYHAWLISIHTSNNDVKGSGF